MAESTTISFYADKDLKDELEHIALMERRSVSNVIRRRLDTSLEHLSPFDQAVLFQVSKDQGLDSTIKAVSLIIRDWQRLKAALEPHRRAPSVDSLPHAPAICVPVAEEA